MTALVLVVDDRREVRQLLAEGLEEVGLRVVQAADAAQGWACYRRAEPDLVVTDARTPRSGGIDLLRRIREVASTPVVVMAAREDAAASLLALSSGAEDLITFPDEIGRLIDRGRRLASRGEPELAPADWLAGSGRRIRRVREQIARLAPAAGPVLVWGECERGREAAVAELHARGPLSSVPIVRVDAAAGGELPETGFVHLGGVERLGPAGQERWSEVLGAEADDAGAPAARRRVIASSTVELATLVARGGFDAGLLRALGRDAIEIPALRDRIDDLRELVPAMVRRLARLHGLHDARVPAPVVTALRRHAWPGNLDELARVLQHAVERARSDVVALGDVEPLLCDPRAGSLRDASTRRERGELATLHADCRGNLAEMARRLGVSRGSVVYRMQKLGLPIRPGTA